MEGEEWRREEKTAIEQVLNVDAITSMQLLPLCFVLYSHSQKLDMWGQEQEERSHYFRRVWFFF
jgi:hypothetical protein